MADETKPLFTLQDVYGEKAAPEPAGGEPYQPPFREPERGVSLDEAYGAKPEAERKLLDQAPGESWFTGVAKGAGTAVIRGLPELPVSPGMYGSLRDLAGMGLSYGESKLTGEPLGEVLSRNKAKEEASYSSPIGQIRKAVKVPSGEDIAEKAYPYTGKYEAEGEPGKLGQAFLSAAVSGISPSGKTGAIKQAVDIAGKSALIGTGGAAADATARYTGSIPLALLAGAATPSIASSLPSIARAHLAPKTMAKDIVGQIGREAADDPAKAAKALAAQEKLIPGVTPNMAQKSGDEGLKNLEQRLSGENRFAPKGAQQRLAETQQEANVEALRQAGEDAAKKLRGDVQTSYNLTGSAPREVASEQARSIFSSLEKSADDAVKNLWKDKALESATMYTQKTIGQLDDYIAKLSPTERNAIPDVILKTIKELKETPGSQIPIDYVQKLRSDLLAKGRAAYANQDDTVGAINYRLAEELKGALSDSKNFSFGGMRGGTSVPKAWQDAVDATRQYHETFNRGFLKKLNQESEAGVNKIPLDATFRAMTSDKKMGAQNLEQLQNATGGKINQMFSDFVVADMTNNGMKIVKPADVDRHIGTHAKLIDQTPGLRDRLIAIRDASQSDLFSASLLKNIDSPEKLSQFLKQNRGEIAELTRNAPKDRAYLRLLEQSANRVKAIPENAPVPIKTLDRLAEGRVSDILYGVATGRLVMAAAGAVGAQQLVSNSAMANILGAIAGTSARSQIGMVNSFVDAALTGKVRERSLELLHDARSNPALMAKLMERPDAQTFKDLFSVQSVRAATTPVASGIEEANDRSGRATGGRVERAFGGQVSQGVEAAANALMQAAETSKKALGRQTEALLNHDDNTIAHALEVANEAI